MGKLAKCIVVALISAPFVVKYLRYRKKQKWLDMGREAYEKAERGEENDEVFEKHYEYFIRLPSFAVAAIIGKRGAMMRKLQNELQLDCNIESYTPEELGMQDEYKIDDKCGWTEKFQTEDWFSEEPTTDVKKVSYLIVSTTDPKKIDFLRVRLAEIIEMVKKPWKSVEFEIETDIVGFIVGRGGRNIRNLGEKFNVQIQILDPTTEKPDKAKVIIRGKDIASIKQAKLVISETVMPKVSDRVPRFDDDPIDENGLFEDVEKELEELKKAGQLLADGFI